MNFLVQRALVMNNLPEIMRPSHPQWNAFLRRLEKNLLQQDNSCAGDFRYTQQTLIEIGDDFDLDGTIEDLTESGVTCDSEIFRLVCCMIAWRLPHPSHFGEERNDPPSAL